jgi:hypothetical protein
MGNFARAIGLGLALVAVAVGVGLAKGDVEFQFGEEGVLTWFSTALLLACSWTAWQVFRRRDGTIHTAMWRESRFLWALIAVAFAFLAADELLKIHETADRVIHDALGFVESRMSDRLDDAIVGAYGLAALGVLALYRAELRFARPHAAVPRRCARLLLRHGRGRPAHQHARGLDRRRRAAVARRGRAEGDRREPVPVRLPSGCDTAPSRVASRRRAARSIEIVYGTLRLV